MIHRNDVIREAVSKCLEELYKHAQPTVTMEEFDRQCMEWAKKYTVNGKIDPDAPPKPYEFYYLDSDSYKKICDNYAEAYRFETSDELKSTINLLIDYCERPIVETYVEAHTDSNGKYHPEHREYRHPDSVVTLIGEENWNKAKELLHMAGDFYKWDHDYQKFSFSIYLGVGPCSNKETVIKNWKKYRHQDIEIQDFNQEEFDECYYE